MTNKNCDENISLERLESAVKIIAKVVALNGELYLPLFNRLHQELIQFKEKQDQKNLALKLALSYSKDT